MQDIKEKGAFRTGKVQCETGEHVNNLISFDNICLIAPHTAQLLVECREKLFSWTEAILSCVTRCGWCDKPSGCFLALRPWILQLHVKKICARCSKEKRGDGKCFWKITLFQWVYVITFEKNPFLLVLKSRMSTSFRMVLLYANNVT